MSAITFYFKNVVPASATLHRSLQDGGTAPTTATTTTGWAVAQNAAGQSCIQNGGSEVSRTDAQWGTTLQPSAAPSQTIGDCWRSENTLTGRFANSNWTFTFGVRSVSAAYTGRLKLAVRVYRTSAHNGGSAVELTGGRIVSAATSANLSTSADTTVTITWTPGAELVFSGEYLFVQVGVEITSAGSGNTQDVDFRVGAAYAVTTPDFIMDVPEFASAGEVSGSTKVTASSAAESVSAVDAVDAPASVFVGNAAEPASAVDAPVGGSDLFAARVEPAAATESGSATVVFAASTTESASAVETNNATQTGRAVQLSWAALQLPQHPTVQNDACTEDATAVDVSSTLAAFAAATSESGSASDTTNGALPSSRQVRLSWAALQTPVAYDPVVAENSPAFDVVTPHPVWLGALNESVAAVDTTSGAIAGLRFVQLSWAALQLPGRGLLDGVVEAASAQDVQSTGFTFTADTAESWLLADTIPQGVNTQLNVAESASAVDVSAASSPLVLVTEFASATNTVNGNATIVASLPELGGGAVDTSTVARVVSAAIVEAAVGVDTATGSTSGTVFSGAVAEVANASDSNVGTTTSSIACVESASANEFASFVGAAPSVVRSEAAVAVETNSASLFAVVSRAEAAVAVDTSGLVGSSSSAGTADSAVVADSSACTVVFQGSIAEGTASAQDIANAAGLWQRFVAEAAAAIDQPLFGLQIGFRGAVENGVAAETIDGIVISLNGLVAESAPAQEQSSAVAVWAAAAVEAAAAIEASATGANVHFVNMPELVVAVDAVDGLQMVGARIELANAQDTSNATKVTLSLAADAANAVDFVDYLSQVFLNNTNEFALAVDTSTAIFATSFSVNEFATALDSASSPDAVFSKGTIESAVAFDTQTAALDTFSIAVESADAAEFIGLAVAFELAGLLWVRVGVSAQKDLWYRSASSRPPLTVRTPL